MRTTFALWRRTVKVNGVDVTVLSGPAIGGMEMTIWPVDQDKRKSEKSPTHELVISERRREPGSDDGAF